LVIEHRQSHAEECLNEIAKEHGALSLFGLPYGFVLLCHLIACCNLLLFGFIGGLIFMWISPPMQYAGVSIGCVIFLTGFVWIIRLHKQNKRIVKEFCRRYIEEAKLLGYTK
jgi:hypothetical protein